MPRRSGEETKALLLQTGMEMLLDRGVSAGVGHIRLQEVVRRAQLTTGAAYRLWADQDEFHRDLAVAVTRWRYDAPIAETSRILETVYDPQSSLDEVIRLAAEAHIRSISGDASPSSRLFLITLALRASARSGADLGVASVDRHLESVATFAEIYALLMTAHGYRMRPPLTVFDFTVAIAALGEGFAVQAIEGIAHPVYRADQPDHDGIDLSGGEWTLFALSVRAVLHGFMTKDPPPGDADSADG